MGGSWKTIRLHVTLVTGRWIIVSNASRSALAAGAARDDSCVAYSSQASRTSRSSLRLVSQAPDARSMVRPTFDDQQRQTLRRVFLCHQYRTLADVPEITGWKA